MSSSNYFYYGCIIISLTLTAFLHKISQTETNFYYENNIINVIIPRQSLLFGSQLTISLFLNILPKLRGKQNLVLNAKSTVFDDGRSHKISRIEIALISCKFPRYAIHIPNLRIWH